MKKTRMTLPLFVLVPMILAACGTKEKNDLVDVDYEIGAPGTLLEGYTSLANTNANGAIVDGKYKAGGIDFQTKETFNTIYSTEIANQKLNYLINTWTYNSEHYTNMVDGLVENDKYGNIVGALALGYKVTDNADGTQTWSFQLRENAEWVNNKTGAKVADVVADDFVAALEYVLDPANGSGTTAQVTGFIKGSAEYLTELAAFESGKSETKPNFADVGVKAPSKYVVEYTLYEVTPYFASNLTYSPYLPVNRQFLKQQGTEFGTTVDNILVNGAFRVTKHDFESKIRYAKNYHYYDRDHVYLKHVNKIFIPSTATLDTTRKWFEAGKIDSFGVNSNDEKGWEKYVTGKDGTGSVKNPYHAQCNSVQSYDGSTFIGYFNYNRTFFAYASDAHAKTAQEKKDTFVTLLNKNFRLGFLRGLEVMQYLQRFGEENAANYLYRGYTNKELASAGGKDYTDYVNDVFNREQGTTGVTLIGVDNPTGIDPVYDAAKAKEFFAAAHEELVGKVANFPVYIDYLGSMNTTLQAFEKAMLASLEAAATLADGTKVLKINYNVPSSSQENTEWGSMYSNFDFSMWSGWGPDYADPNTFLHTMCIYGDMVDYMGFPTSETDLAGWELSEFASEEYQALVEGSGEAKDYSKAIAKLQEDVLGNFDQLYRAAAAITDPTKTAERFAAFAEAEYELIYEEGIIIPWLAQNGFGASVSKAVPWQAGRASYGLTDDKMKNTVLTKAAMTKEQRAAVTAEYDAGK